MLELKTININDIAVLLPINHDNKIIQMRCIFDINNNLIADKDVISSITNGVLEHNRMFHHGQHITCNMMYVRFTISPRNILENIIK